MLGCVVPAQDGFDPAHQDTDFPRWVNATQPYELNNTHEL